MERHSKRIKETDTRETKNNTRRTITQIEIIRERDGQTDNQTSTPTYNPTGRTTQAKGQRQRGRRLVKRGERER